MLPRRSIVFRGVLAIVFGVVTTVLVSLGCALWIDVVEAGVESETYVMSDSGDRIGMALVWQSGGASRVLLFDDPSAGDSSDWQVAIGHDQFIDPEIGSRLSWFVATEPLSANGGQVFDARGWPRRAFSGGFELATGAGPITDQWNVLVLSATTGLPSGDRVRTPIIPLAPIWSGIIFNSLIYGAAWGVLLISPGMVRRSIRRARGRCTSCGYDLRGAEHLVCPECGLERTR